MRDLGPTYIPPLPLILCLEDRAVPGKYWALTHDQAGQRVGIKEVPEDILPSERGYQVFYDAFHGPIVNLPRRPDKIVRLLVREHRLGFEALDWPRGTLDQDQPKLWTRKNLERFALEVMNVALTDNGWTSLGVPWNPGYRVYEPQVGVEND